MCLVDTAGGAAHQRIWRGRWILIWDSPQPRSEKLKYLDCLSGNLLQEYPFLIENSIPVFVRFSTRTPVIPAASLVKYQDTEALRIQINQPRLSDVAGEIFRLLEGIQSLSRKSGDQWKAISIPKRSRMKSLTVTLLYLKDVRDTRWRSMATPPAPLILAEAAERQGHRVRIAGVEGAADWLEKLIGDADVIGISVYEDHFEAVSNLVRILRHRFHGWIVAGGPMATLAPSALAAHLPEADFILAGEADETFPEMLNILGQVNRNSIDRSPGKLIRLASVDGLIGEGSRFVVSGGFPSPVPANPDPFFLSTTHLTLDDFQKGLDLMTSRGCPRKCRFCSHIQGRVVRERSLDAVKEELDRLWKRAVELGWEAISSKPPVLNINDDDFLLHPDRCLRILELIRERGFRIWGLQTSLGSLNRAVSRFDILARLKDIGSFAGEFPVLWIGTDAFSDDRLSRLGKSGTCSDIVKICSSISQNDCLGYHYWILTDADSDWPEFFEELFFIRQLALKHGDSFHVLPNAGTLIPYPSTDIYRMRVRSSAKHRVLLRALLAIENAPAFDYPLVKHERPVSDYLYALIEPRAETSERLRIDAWEFIEHIRRARFDHAFALALRAMNMEMDDLRHSDLKRVRILAEWKDRYIERLYHGDQSF